MGKAAGGVWRVEVGRAFFSKVLKSRAQEDKKLAKEEREERPTLKQVVCIDGSRFFFSLSLSLSHSFFFSFLPR